MPSSSERDCQAVASASLLQRENASLEFGFILFTPATSRRFHHLVLLSHSRNSGAGRCNHSRFNSLIPVTHVILQIYSLSIGAKRRRRRGNQRSEIEEEHDEGANEKKSRKGTRGDKETNSVTDGCSGKEGKKAQIRRRRRKFQSSLFHRPSRHSSYFLSFQGEQRGAERSSSLSTKKKQQHWLQQLQSVCFRLQTLERNLLPHFRQHVRNSFQQKICKHIVKEQKEIASGMRD